MFWIITLFCILFLIGIAVDSGPLLTGFVSAFCCLVFFTSPRIIDIQPVIEYINHNPSRFALGCSSYFIIGFFWSLFKWFKFSIDVKRVYLKATKNQSSDKTHLSNAEWPRNFNTPYIWDKESIIPKFDNYTGEIIFWTSYWPLSVIWFLIADVVRWIGTEIVELGKSAYNKISQFVFRGI